MRCANPETANHALQRTAPRVTARAFCERRVSYICASSVRSTVGHAPRHAPPSLSLRSLGDLLAHSAMKQFLILIALLSASCSFADEQRVRHDGYMKAWEDQTVASVSYGFTDDKLHFVVFESAHKEIVPHASITTVTRPEGYNMCSGFIRLPDGTKPDLPSSGRIYEFTSGTFASSPIDFTRRQLKNYLQSNPKPPTIDGLRRFISKQP